MLREASLGVGEAYVGGWWEADTLDEAVFQVVSTRSGTTRPTCARAVCGESASAPSPHAGSSREPISVTPSPRRQKGWYARVAGAVLLVAILAGGYLAFVSSPELQSLLRPEAVRAWVERMGPWGPPALVAGMALAIVFSPVPSAPIALAAGALYGHTWGTVYSILGAEIGALIAFGIARVLGRPFVARILPDQVLAEEDRTDRPQWLLAGGVLVARLFPFISFDAVSYLAGVTPLRPSLFALATFVGMIPMTFLFAHLGGAMTAEEEPLRLLNFLGVLGVAGLIWLGWRLWVGRREGA